MTESGFSGLPTGVKAPQTASSRSSGDNAQTARLVGVPNEVRTEANESNKPVKLRGEVVRVNDDGSVRIRTPRGDVDVQIPPETKSADRPKVGQRVEVEIPPQRTADQQVAQQVIIRPAPIERPAEQPPVRDSATPVNIEVRPAPPPVEAETTPVDVRHPPRADGFPPVGSLIRLEPITPEQLQAIIAEQPLPDILRTPITQVETTTQQPILLEVQELAIALQTPLQTITKAPLEALQQATPQASFAAPVQNPVVQIAVPSPSEEPFSPLQAFLKLEAIQNTAVVMLPQPPEQNSQLIVLPTQQAETSIQLQRPLQNFYQAQIIEAATQLTTPNTPLISEPTVFDARIAAINPPNVQIVAPEQPSTITAHQPPPILTETKAGNITGVITAKTPEQIPIVTFTLPQAFGNPPIEQSFALTFPNETIPLGTQIQVSPQTNSPAFQQAFPLTQIPLATFLAPQPWPVLTEIYQTLTQIAPQAAQAMSATTPNPAASPAQFGAAALFFVSAVRGGDIQSWLGEKAVQALRDSGKGGLLTRLNNEGGLLNRIANDAPAQDWRAMNIPLLWDGQMHKIALHYRHEDHSGEQKQQNGQKGARFVFDLSLSAMGKVQIDGLFRPVSRDGPRLDVILRTQEHFSQSMQAEMRRVYTDALRPSQVGGELSFQIASEGWVTIQAEHKTALGVEA